jgi:UDPglucose--hexose-1-phosphate uridylyltransferase
MPTASIQIGSNGAGRPVFRRTHVNKDGRRVLFYSHAPYAGDPVSETLVRTAGTGELRWHPLRHEWNIYAPARQDRTHKPDIAADPLAPGRPNGPPTEIPFADFDLAIFENRFPSLSGDRVDVSETGAQRRPASGRCEVVVYGPETEGSLATLTHDRRRLLVAAWNDRYSEMFAAGREFVLPFENRGDEAGVTLHHPHGQIYAFDFVPAVQAASERAFAAGFDLAARLRLWRDDFEVMSAGGLSVFAPPFARFPFELWIASETPRRGPWEYNPEELDAYASLLGEVARRYDDYFGRPTPYMMSLHAAPRRAGAGFQFTTQFYPLLRSRDKVKFLASIEQATGVFTVDVLPEWAAKELRR